MTIAWYGHLKYKTAPLLVAILVSWLIALPEYALQVPANRWGHMTQFSAPQLKILQEVITIGVFVVFNYLYLKEAIRWTDFAAFLLIISAVIVMMYPRMTEAAAAAVNPPVSEVAE